MSLTYYGDQASIDQITLHTHILELLVSKTLWLSLILRVCPIMFFYPTYEQQVNVFEYHFRRSQIYCRKVPRENQNNYISMQTGNEDLIL